MTRRSRIVVPALILGAVGLAPARAGSPPVDGASCAAHAPEAASRAGLSTDIVLRVMAAESGGNPRIVSSKGAMGCMQIMPATWVYLSRHYRLGTDPYDPRQSMIAGAAYLAELTARYGLPGALAAYNAGPTRYDRYTAGRATLPSETVAYAARIVGGSAAFALPPVKRWQEADLFLARASLPAPADPPSPVAQNELRQARGSLFPLAAINQNGDAPPERP